jgi:4-diphosphocytidyl-2-C-methyl-D-erythritol kinase
MISFPNAKINLGLFITEKRSDGYHNIETVFYPVGLCDALEFVIGDRSSNEDQLRLTGYETDCSENIVLKAARRLHEIYSFPYLNIHLHKAVPVGAGLGGGSSDAVGLMKVVNKVFSLEISDHELKDLSLEFGSDCPFFVNNTPATGRSRGELLSPVRNVLEGYYIIILNPGIVVSTKDAYNNCKPRTPARRIESIIELASGSMERSND